ncbi:MAG TPA: response regulator transcription factor [Actinomycetota bacterium]|nr:response regulator transcription factor [Actinomycetota bacterium]
MPKSVLIVDDYARFRVAARDLLEGAGFDVVGECADGGSALDLTAVLDPDLVLLDVQLPDIDGFEVAERLAKTGVRSRVLLVSSRAASDYGTKVEEARTLGFICKSDLSVRSLRRILNG